MQQALNLADQALFITSPNPRVGCVIVDAQGKVIGQGHTQKAGGPHAEIVALQDAALRGHSVEGATVYVTLEPCAHQGRTGPCCDALVQAKVGKVVAALTDPNPLVAGQGFDRLRAAGIEVQVGDGASEAALQNPGFLSRMQRQKPWVRMKIAASLDGQTALQNGQSQWITGPEARADGHAWRARACAILTGIGTVLEDNPLLDLRLCTQLGPTPRMPHLVIVDSRLETPLDARLFQHASPESATTTNLDLRRSRPPRKTRQTGSDGCTRHPAAQPTRQGRFNRPPDRFGAPKRQRIACGSRSQTQWLTHSRRLHRRVFNLPRPHSAGPRPRHGAMEAFRQLVTGLAP